MSRASWFPTGIGPVGRRMLGVHSLLADSTLRLRSLVAVVEDIADGIVVQPIDDDQAVLRLLVGSLVAELRSLDMLTDRIRELAVELSRDGPR